MSLTFIDFNLKPSGVKRLPISNFTESSQPFNETVPFAYPRDIPPSAPVAPTGPCGPVPPVAPVAPATPCGPVAPVAPGNP